MALVGLAHVPRPIAHLLASIGAKVALAGAELYAISRRAADVDGLAEVVASVERMADQTAAEAAHMLGGGLDRSDVLAVARSLEATARRIHEVGATIQLAGAAFPRDALAGVQRDVGRELATLAERFEGGPEPADAAFERAEALCREGRRLHRVARAGVQRERVDPVAALEQLRQLDVMGLALHASRDSVRVIRRVAIKHG